MSGRASVDDTKTTSERLVLMRFHRREGARGGCRRDAGEGTAGSTGEGAVPSEGPSLSLAPF